YSTEEFSLAFQSSFHFKWPFSFEDTYMFDDELDQYAPTPLFERYHKDLRSWKMDRSFLERFPDLAYDI
ncbi:hypothetical protein K432DRAFT_257390, partial [Lepidopterella palustris CBS 459.81]